MSDNGKIRIRVTDWENVTFIVAVFALIVLFAGSPDLMDAIVARVGGAP